MPLFRRRSFKPFLASALVLALVTSAQARDPDAVPEAAATASAAGAVRAPPVPLLWKVSDADNSIYLLGSFHLLKPDDYPLSRDVEAAFADAESLVFELSPDEMGSPALAAQMGQAALRGDGTRLDSELSATTRARLQAWADANAPALQAMGMTPEVLQLFEPWFAGLVVTIAEMTKMGLDPRLGLDAHLAGMAAAAAKPAEGLETGAEQIAFLDGMGAREQLQFLDEALSESEDGRDAMRKLHAAWRAGDAATLWRQMALEMRRDYPELYRRINVARNDAWVPRIARRLDAPGADDTLVVVGALHLLGEDGVVEKLRSRGYRVERVCSACGSRARGRD